MMPLEKTGVSRWELATHEHVHIHMHKALTKLHVHYMCMKVYMYVHVTIPDILYMCRNKQTKE